MEKTTNTLTNVLKKTKPDGINEFLKDNSGELLSGEHPFSVYMKNCIKEKGIQQKDVFLAADISDGYGYKLLSEEKHTKQRDVILRLCLGARLTLDETQRALKIYGMSPLYSRLPRDAVIIVAIESGIYEISHVNQLLAEHGEVQLRLSI